jgi:hypothetical protein
MCRHMHRQAHVRCDSEKEQIAVPRNQESRSADRQAGRVFAELVAGCLFHGSRMLELPPCCHVVDVDRKSVNLGLSQACGQVLHA